MTRRGVAALLAVAVVPLGWCLAFGAVLGGDPMLGLEIAAGALAISWGALVVRELMGSGRVARALDEDAEEALLFGVPVRITSALGADAVVVGSIRPRIFVGTVLLSTLSDDEIEAVLLHEDHHRRTRAPLRAAALGAWLRIFGPSRRIQSLLLERLADLETMADDDAIQRGSSPRSLARALLKGEPTIQPVSFAYAAERRVEQLIDRAAGHAITPAARVPYEWLPVVALAVAMVGCHAGF